MFLIRIPPYLVAAMVLALSACGSNQIITSDTNSVNANSSVEETDSLNRLLPAIEEAKLLLPPARDEALLDIAESINALQNIDTDTQYQAINQLLAEINTNWLGIEAYARFAVLASHTYSALEDQNALYTLLYDKRIVFELDRFEAAQQIDLWQKRAEVNEHFKLINEAINSRISLAALLEDTTDIAQNNELIWLNLNSLGQEDIEAAIATSHDNILTGWHELAAIDQQFNERPEEKYRAIKQWIFQHPDHPAAIDLPIDLQFLLLAFQNQPTHIALILPTSGKFASAASAIRDGFFSAYYHSGDINNQPLISLYDSSTANINQIYDTAVANGADLIIGPLEKENVATLATHNLSVPTLALNYIDIEDNTIPSDIYLYQFGLSLEDEAKQVANHAAEQGLKYALIIADSGDWSLRTARAFIDQWQTLGGIIVDQRSYAKETNYSDEIKSLLNISDSQNRSIQLKRLFGQTFEFEPRRRNDIDMIFLVARSREGRQIKPILDFHYASDIPVYATSQLFSSVEDTTKTRDLNGVKLVTLPWVIEESFSKQAVTENIRVSASFERLYALGYDAYQLHNRLSILSYTPVINTIPFSTEQTIIEKPSIAGATGQLTIDVNRRVKRKQPFVEILKGKAEQLPQTIVLEDD